MNKAIKEAASTLCKDDCKFGSDKNNTILCVLIAVIFFCCGGSGFLGGGNSCGEKDCRRGAGLGGSWIVILIILLCFCGKDGLGGVLGTGGNVNTNVINVETDDSYDDEYDDI
jgi:hypothetical protein